MHHLFLSPHLDDAVGSCGGTIAKLRGREESVTVFNLFSGVTRPPYSPEAMDIHRTWGDPPNVVRLRRAEDKAAAEKLGASVHFESIPDSLYRKNRSGEWLYGKEGDIFGPRHADDDWLVSHFARRVQEYAEPYGCQIYTALGIGAHLDHLIAFEVGCILIACGYQVLFYEDFPYANDVDAWMRRTASLTGWTPIVEPLTRRWLSLKIDAFAYYRTQIPMLFGSMRKMDDAVRKSAEIAGGVNHRWGERYWSCDDSSG